MENVEIQLKIQKHDMNFGNMTINSKTQHRIQKDIKFRNETFGNLAENVETGRKIKKEKIVNSEM